LAAETDRRGRAAGPMIDELEGSVEKKAEFLIRMGFDDLDWIADEPTPGVTSFHVRNPMPMSGGRYLVHFLKRAPAPVDPTRGTTGGNLPCETRDAAPLAISRFAHNL